MSNGAITFHSQKFPYFCISEMYGIIENIEERRMAGNKAIR